MAQPAQINENRYWNIVALQKRYAQNHYRDWEGFWDGEGLKEKLDGALANYKDLEGVDEEFLNALRDITMNLAYELGDHADEEFVTQEYVTETMGVVYELLTCADWLKSTAR